MPRFTVHRPPREEGHINLGRRRVEEEEDWKRCRVGRTHTWPLLAPLADASCDVTDDPSQESQLTCATIYYTQSSPTQKSKKKRLSHLSSLTVPYSFSLYSTTSFPSYNNLAQSLLVLFSLSLSPLFFPHSLIALAFIIFPRHKGARNREKESLSSSFPRSETREEKKGSL